MKSVIKGRYKANVGAGAGSGARAETFWKSEPEPEWKLKVSAPQHWYFQEILFTASIEAEDPIFSNDLGNLFNIKLNRTNDERLVVVSPHVWAVQRRKINRYRTVLYRSWITNLKI